MKRVENLKNTEDINKWYQEMIQDIQQMDHKMIILSEICSLLFWMFVILDSVFYNEIGMIRYYAIFSLFSVIVLIIKDRSK